MKKAIVLMSGGLDSSTVLAMAIQQNFEIYALSFNYSQNHSIELEKVQQFIKSYPVKEHKIIDLDLSAFFSSALINNKIEVPKYNNANDLGSEVPVTYVPARNTIFLSYALGYAEMIQAYDIFIGAHVTDSANYPDCRANYLKSFEQMANLATKSAIEGNKISIHAPLINMSKTEVLSTGLALSVDYSNTISCYDPITDAKNSKSCGKCHACLVRINAFKENNLRDPILYI